MARFKVSGTAALESLNLFVIAGDVTEGVIVPGMIVHIPVNSKLSIALPVESVEYIRHSDRPEEIGLCIKYADRSELDTWQALNIDSELIEVSESSQSS